MIDMIAYIALTLALFAMMSTRIVVLRSIHLVSCLFYAIYGIMSGANPIFIGAILFGPIHTYHLFRNSFNRRKDYEQNRQYTSN